MSIKETIIKRLPEKLGKKPKVFYVRIPLEDVVEDWGGVWVGKMARGGVVLSSKTEPVPKLGGDTYEWVKICQSFPNCSICQKRNSCEARISPSK